MAYSAERNFNPKTQVPTTNLGHPPPLYTFPRSAAVIFSPCALCPQTQNFSESGPPALVGQVACRTGNGGSGSGGRGGSSGSGGAKGGWTNKLARDKAQELG